MHQGHVGEVAHVGRQLLLQVELLLSVQPHDNMSHNCGKLQCQATSAARQRHLMPTNSAAVHAFKLSKQTMVWVKQACSCRTLLSPQTTETDSICSLEAHANRITMMTKKSRRTSLQLAMHPPSAAWTSLAPWDPAQKLLLNCGGCSCRYSIKPRA